MDSAALLATLLQLAAAFSVYGPQPPPPPQPPPQSHRGGGYPPDPDCYERVAVGRRLNESAASAVLTAATARRCEQECERAKCLAFSFGISHAGNGSCLLASKLPSTEETITDIDYDLFYKNADCIKRISCYKRMAIGRSLIDRLVRRSLLCDSLRACEEACQAERAFQCEGFNFKFDPNGVDNKCQLTDVKSHKLDLTRDFNPDVNFDFYDRDLNGPRQCFRGPEFEGGGGLPPSGGYPGSGPGDPGFPALGEEPPGGQRYPASEPPGGQRYPPRLEPPGGPRGPHYPPPLEPPGGPAGPHYPPRYPPQPPPGGPLYPQPPPGGEPPGGNALIPLDYPDEKGLEYGGGGAYPLGASRGGLPDECFLRSRSGFRLDRRVVLVSISVPSLYECESMCVSERKFKCNVFSFRYAVNPSVPTHNCHLGEKPYLELDPYQDLQPDRDFDVYERNPTGLQGCQPKKSWGPECFERVRSGLKLNTKMVKFALKCSSLKECEFACLNVPYFTCRAFSYRYGPPVIGEGEENCLLTDWPVPEMNAGQHLAEDPDCELYHRGSYGHGCEVDRALTSRPPGALYPGGYPGGPGGSYPSAGEVGRPLPPRPLPDHYPPPPANEIPNSYSSSGGKPPLGGGYYPQKPNSYLPPPPSYLPPPPGGGGSPYPNGRGDYYPHLKPSAGYLPPSQKPGGYLPPPPRRPEGYLPPNKDQDYPRKPCCSGGQNSYLPPPKSYPQGPPPAGGGGGSKWETHGSFGGGRESYGSFGGRRPGNSYLPPPPGSYGGGPSYDGRLQPSDQLCYVRYSSPARLLPKSIKNSLWVPGEAACKQECTRAREKTRFRCATLSYREGQCELSDVEQRDLRPGYDYLRDENDFWLFTWDFGAPGCVQSPPLPPTTASYPSYQGERGGDDTWSRFTVNGQPCLPGTACAPSRELGVWSCPTSAGGDWDYCCRAGHHCGYSEGYDYPWCYVGETSREQWRPCSDTYLPYPHSGRKTHWPVAYLHREGPPNATLSTTSNGSPHKPSIVESFLKSLEKSGIRPTSPPVEGRSETMGTTGGGGEESALDKMLTWGKTALRNLTTAMTPPASSSAATSSSGASPPTSPTAGNSTSSVGTTVGTTAGTTLTTGGTLQTTTVLPTSLNNNITTQTSSTPSTQT